MKVKLILLFILCPSLANASNMGDVTVPIAVWVFGGLAAVALSLSISSRKKDNEDEEGGKTDTVGFVALLLIFIPLILVAGIFAFWLSI